MKRLYADKRVRAAVKVIVPAAILAWLFVKLDVSVIARSIARTDPLLFAVSFAVLCLRNVMGAWRSSMFLGHLGMRHTVAVLTKYYFIGNFFNLFMPELVGRDLARGYYLYNSGDRKSESVSSIVAERFNGAAALFTISLIAALAGWALGMEVVRFNVVRGIAAVFGLFLVVTAVIMHRRTEQALESLLARFGATRLRTGLVFARDVITYCKSPALMARTFAVSLVFQFSGVVATWLIALSLGDSTGFEYFAVILPMIWVVGMLPVSINGLGVREGAFVVLFGAVGMPQETAMAISLLWFAQNIGLGIIGGVLVAGGKGKPGSPTDT